MTWGKKRAIVIGALILFFVLIVWAASMSTRLRGLPGNSVLVIDVSGEIDEQRPPDVFGSLTGRSALVMHDYVDAIDSARNDPHIDGLVVRIGPLETGWSKLEEIRSHLLAFQASGKPSICYLGYDGIGNPEYYLATSCQKIWLVPTAQVSITGMMAEALFLRGTLDKLKIVPEFYHIAEYKAATNTYTEKKFTPAHREEVESVLHGIYGRYVSEAAQARHIDPAQFEREIALGPLLTSEAVQSHVVDRLAYWDQVQDYFKSRYRVWNPISLSRYRAFVFVTSFSGQKIAVIYATGMIVSGSSGYSPTDGILMGGDSVASDLRQARKDPSIRAIVLRIDSGGGSVVASEVIRREVELARGAKPLVVSMSDTAASGGYWIATPANKIVAEPNTITGSIGVLTGKLNLAGLYSLLGLSTDYVATSDNATLFSDQQNFTPQQEAYIEKSLHETYSEFTRGVAEGRGLSVEAVDKIGKGREWTGAQAKDLGLVDDLGGLDRAIEVAKDLAHIPASQSVHIVRLPEEQSLFEQLFEREEGPLDQSRSLAATLRELVGVMDPVQARIPFELRIR
jgi:protease-4